MTRRRIVLTRPAALAQPWAVALRLAGLTPLLLPTSVIAPPDDPAPLRQALRDVAAYDGLVFASANAVHGVARHAVAAPRADAWICAVGPATAAALTTALGEAWRATIVPGKFHAAGILAALAPQPLTGQRVLLPQSAEAGAALATGLGAQGARVTAVTAYRPEPDWTSQAAAQELFPSAGPSGAEVVLFASGSAARHLALLLGPDYRKRMDGVAIATLGPESRKAAAALELVASIEPAEPTLAALLEALTAHFSRA